MSTVPADPDKKIDSIDELEHDMYCDDSAKKNEEETSELNFDY